MTPKRRWKNWQGCEKVNKENKVANSLSKQTILVVDDTPENIDILGGILGRDYKIKFAINGEKALKIARDKDPPDLILLDIMMPWQPLRQPTGPRVNSWPT